MRLPGRLYVVLAIDSEGPVEDPSRTDLLETWPAVDASVRKLFSASLRRYAPDSSGKSAVISWFVMHWTGFKTNPVSRRFGYHRIYDHYMRRWATLMSQFGDGIYWHYHHPSPNGIANQWNGNWSTGPAEYHNILNRWIIDRAYFPSVFRAGGTIESNESSRWLERYIPFDYSSRAGPLNWDARDSSGKRLRDLCDWSRAPSDWSWYRPSASDYQSPGEMRRSIFRCPELKTGNYTLTGNDIESAFDRAGRGYDTVIAAFDHDYRDRAKEYVDLFYEPISRLSKKYPTVEWSHASALEAARNVVGASRGKGPRFTLRVTGDGGVISASAKLFGPTPYVAGKDLNGTYGKLDVERLSSRKARVAPQALEQWNVLGIAACDESGNVGVTRFEKTTADVWRPIDFGHP